MTNIILPFESNKYELLLADPPWEYEDKMDSNKIRGAITKYNTMNFEEIKNMKDEIIRVSKKDSYLFLWITTPLLPYGLDVMKEWGYTYKTFLCWNKLGRFGMGSYFRVQTELCLVGKKGDIKPLHIQKRNVIESVPTEHSEKPEELYYIIEETKLNPKLELFARNKFRGWDVWGNEIEDKNLKVNDKLLKFFN